MLWLNSNETVRQNQLVRTQPHAGWLPKSNIDIWNKQPRWAFLRGVLQSASFSRLCRFTGKIERGSGGGEKKKKKRGCQKNKITFNLFPITAVCTASAEQLLVPVFLFLSRTCLCRELRVAGSQQTLIALRPKAATFKQGHSSSHGKGNGLWPWSLITPLPQCTRSSGKLSDKHSRSYTVHAYTHTHTHARGRAK